jgi:hypothetical protein
MKASKKEKAVKAVVESKAPKGAALTASQLAGASKAVQQVVAAINPGVPAMTVTDRRKAVKVRKGGEKYLPLLAELAATYGVQTSIHSVSAMTASAAMVQQLAPLKRQAQVLLKMVEDIELRANSGMWGTATFVYSALKRIAAQDGDLALTLAPIEEFFTNKVKTPATDTAASTGSASADTGETATTTATSATPETTEAQPAPTVAPATTHA